MKRVILSALFLAGVCASMSSCNNGDYNAVPSGGVNWNPGSGSSGGSGSIATTGTDPMSATVNGAAWTATANGGTFFNNSGMVLIAGSASDNSTISLTLMNYNGVGTYSGSNAAGGYMVNASTTYASGMGGSCTVQITEDDATHVKGGFYFSGKTMDGTKSVTINMGYFNIKK